MTKNLGYTYEMAIEVASRYEWKTDFQNAHKSLYKYAYRRGWWPDMCRHMNKYVRKPDWTEELIREAAKNVSNKSDFARIYPGAYMRALKAGNIEEICAHMERKRIPYSEFENGRTCKTCGVFKEKSEMARNSNSKSGIGNKCKSCEYERNKEYWRANLDWKRAQTALRRAKKANATPPWITKQHKKQISLLYKKAKSLTEETGIVHEVDHIVPIAGKNVCGLHLPWNMQVITREKNRKKLNKLEAV